MILIPEKPEMILSALQKKGFEAYIVGGCVRDSLLGIQPHDWDICSSALPSEIISCFSGFSYIDSGLKHGTVALIVDGDVYEITTYRTDGAYSDYRHPDDVKFVQDIKGDLSRRDFTINAMAYNQTKGLIDIFGGRADLQQKIVRCVGDAGDRFQQDALRILRAVRFACRFGFAMDIKTKVAAYKYKDLLLQLPAERIIPEINEILLNGLAGRYINEYRELLSVVLPLEEKDYSSLNFYSENIAVKLSVIFCLQDAMDSEEVFLALKKLKYPNSVRKAVMEYVQRYRIGIREDDYSVRKLVGETDKNFALNLAEIFVRLSEKGDGSATDYLCNVQKIIKEENCFKISDLNVDGRDVISAGITGALVGVALSTLLERVISGKITNEREVLLKELFRIKMLNLS